MLGFETCGNATVICHDGRPILCTDPWVHGTPYFGSWTHKFPLDARQVADATACDYVWFSHGHPDHLDPASVALFLGRTILLPDHVGGRIARDLKAQGHRVHVLPNDRWFPLTDRIRILCLSDYYQDAQLLIDIGGNLVIDANDTSVRDWQARTRQLAAKAKRSFLLKLISHGDADMMNFFDAEGRRVVPPRIKAVPLGAKVGAALEAYRATFYIPFSTAHQYQRTDSAWANEYVVRDFAEMREGLAQPDRMLPANIVYDVERGQHTETRPAPAIAELLPPERFGDVWSDRLDAGDAADLKAYFGRIRTLRGAVDFVTLRVGGHDTVVELARRGFKRGIVFEAPRKSLMDAVRWRIFDDLLIGNFMKASLVGIKSLYPAFTPSVARYSDNAGVHDPQALRAYMAEYRRRNPLQFMKHELAVQTTQRLRTFVLSNDQLLRSAYRAYRLVHR